MRPCGCFHAAATWTWTQELTGELVRWESRALYRMMGMRMRPAETCTSFQARRTTLARKAFHASRCESLVAEAISRQFTMVKRSMWDCAKSGVRRRGLGQ